MNFSFPNRAPRVREPVFFIPAIVIVLIVALFGLHALLQTFDEAARDNIYMSWGFVPGRFTYAVAPQWINELVARSAVDPDALTAARFLRESGALADGAGYVTLVSYAFLHGSWAHVGVNSLWLVAFGPPIARRFGAARFLLFFVFTAVAGALLHWLFAPYEAFPMIGASASDSGLMAAAARFIFRPGAALSGEASSYQREATRVRASTLRELLTDRRALIFIAIWMATNYGFGAGASVLGASDAPIAWIAHVGGFVAGLFGFPLFDRAPAAPQTFLTPPAERQ